MFQSMEAPLILFLVILLLVGPILGIIAFVGVRRLSEAFRRQNPQELTARLYALEQRLAKLEKAGQAPLAAAVEPVPHALVSPPSISTPTVMAPIPPVPPVPAAKPREAAPPPP